MRIDTDVIHERLSRLGARLGFIASREQTSFPLSAREPGQYAPRADVVWSLPLSPAQRAALDTVTNGSVDLRDGLPFVGFEVEASTPTTKTFQADFLNLAAMALPLGFIVTAESSEKGLYRRSSRVIRTLRRALGTGSRVVLPLEASWLDSLETVSVAPRATPRTAPSGAGRRARGGESHEIGPEARACVRTMGARAGFEVVEHYTPPILRSLFDVEMGRVGAVRQYLWDPVSRTERAMTKPADLFTGSEIDMAWLLPVPDGLSALLERVVAHDQHLATEGMVFADLFVRVAIAGFEIESTFGKHAGGAFATLASHCVLGVIVTPDEASHATLERIKRTYARTLGLGSVHVWRLP